MRREQRVLRADDSAPAVLVVEDEPAITHLLRLPLTGAGFRVIETGNAHDALAFLKEKSVDAALVDPGLPDGLAGNVLANLRDMHERGRIQGWFVLSASAERDLQRKYGAMDGHYISKPFDPFEVAALVDDELNGRER